LEGGERYGVEKSAADETWDGALMEHIWGREGVASDARGGESLPVTAASWHLGVLVAIACVIRDA